MGQGSFNFHQLTTREGLSDGVVRAIGQDKYGYIWIGSLSALNRFNGYDVKKYEHVPGDSLSLPASGVRSILGDSAGNLWIGCPDGLRRFNYTTKQFNIVPSTNAIGVERMIEYKKDDIFLLT